MKRERFVRDEWPRQVGNLASTLARTASRAASEGQDRIVSDLLREGALLMEWCAPHVPRDLAAELAAMQRELILWRRLWPSDEARALLIHRTRDMSDRLLRAAGLL
jgi:hypothetical protein